MNFLRSKESPVAYSLAIYPIFVEAWHAVRGLKKSIWMGLIPLFLMTLGLQSMLALLLSGCRTLHWVVLQVILPSILQGMIQLLQFVISVSLIFLALQQLRRQPVSTRMILAFRQYWKPLTILGVLFYLFDQVLLVITTRFVLPQLNGSSFVFMISKIVWAILGIWLYATVALCVTMAALLILDQQMAPRRSLPMAVTAIGQHYAKNIILFILTFSLSLILGLASLGIGFIWLYPWLFLVIAAQYRQIFCKGGVGPIER